MGASQVRPIYPTRTLIGPPSFLSEFFLQPVRSRAPRATVAITISSVTTAIRFAGMMGNRLSLFYPDVRTLNRSVLLVPAKTPATPASGTSRFRDIHDVPYPVRGRLSAKKYVCVLYGIPSP